MESLVSRDHFWSNLGLQHVERHHSQTVPISCYVDPCRRFEQRGRPFASRHTEFEQNLTAVRHLMEWSYGYTARGGGLRRAPSAGGLYPTEVYVFGMEGVTARGLYLSFREHAFYGAEGADCAGVLDSAKCKADDLAVVLGSVLWRTVQRYGVRGYRYCLLDAGTIAFNVGEIVGAIEEATPVEVITPRTRMERMLAFPYGEGCALVLRIPGPTVRALRDLPAAPLADALLSDGEAEMPPVLSPGLRRAAMFHARAIFAGEAEHEPG